MLLQHRLPSTLAAVLQPLRGCFTAPTFTTFCTLVTGLIAMPAGRTVTGMLVGAGVSAVWHHSRGHRFFTCARWDTDMLGLALLSLVVDRLLPPAAEVTIAIDDTLFRRAGRRVHAAAWQHDGSARRPPGIPRLSYGNCFVVAAILIWLPFRSRPISLPVLTRLYRPGTPGTGRHNQRARRGPGKATKPALARQMINLIAAAIGDRRIHVVADAGYATSDMRYLPAHVTYTTRARSNAAFRHPATPQPGKRGAPRIYGDPVTPADLTANPTQSIVTCYGKRQTHTAATTPCLWPGVFARQPVRVIIVTSGKDTLQLITTDLTTAVEQIVERYGARWAIEVTFTDAKTITGVGEARNRTTTAVERTAPFGLYTTTIVVLWYAEHGHDPADITDRRARQPWYRTKTEPSYSDMITKLRRELIKHRNQPQSPDQPTPPEILDLLAALPDLAA
jgi:SRSO17 transposase